jgi:hypothetical protein
MRLAILISRLDVFLFWPCGKGERWACKDHVDKKTERKDISLGLY